MKFLEWQVASVGRWVVLDYTKWPNQLSSGFKPEV